MDSNEWHKSRFSLNLLAVMISPIELKISNNEETKATYVIIDSNLYWFEILGPYTNISERNNCR